MSPGRPDHRLRSLLAEARWTGQQLASAVNAVGAEAGLRLRYDRTSVAHWLSGSTPNAPVPELIAEAFTRRLGREIAAGARPDESERAHGPPGARPASGGPGLCPSEDAIAALVELRSGRRRTPRGGVYSITELAVPPWPAATAAAPPIRPANGRIGREEAEGAAAMARVFSDGDATFGGGRQVAALSSYLALDVAPKLRARAGPTVRAAMFAAATDLAYLCAFMHFDSEQHATAQRYYRTALKLAAENHDPTRYATILRAMSVQAHTLRHHRQALDLAEASLTSAPGTVAPITRAFLLGQAAVAAAGTGDKPTALTHLRRAEALLERGTGPGGATGAYHHAMASNYNHFARPPVIAVRDGRARPLIRRETEEDMLRRDVG